MTNNKSLFKISPRSSVIWSLREPANMSQNWFPDLSPQKSVLMFPRRSAPDPEPTPGR